MPKIRCPFNLSLSDFARLARKTAGRDVHVFPLFLPGLATWEGLLWKCEIHLQFRVRRKHVVVHCAKFVIAFYSHTMSRYSHAFLNLCRMGHAAIALRLLRVERPLSSHKLLDLAHHLLKANKSLRSGSGSSSSKLSQAILLLSSCENVATALVSPTNIYATNLKACALH